MKLFSWKHISLRNIRAGSSTAALDCSMISIEFGAGRVGYLARLLDFTPIEIAEGME